VIEVAKERQQKEGSGSWDDFIYMDGEGEGMGA
jgi:hypothetical protein